MSLPVFAFLLVVCPPLSLALLWCLDWLRLRPSSLYVKLNSSPLDRGSQQLGKLAVMDRKAKVHFLHPARLVS